MTQPLRVQYILKQYPRLSETFILNELLALQAEGVEASVYSLRPPLEGRFHSALSQFRGEVRYAPRFGRTETAEAFKALAEVGPDRLPRVLAFLDLIREEYHADLLIESIALAGRVRRGGIDHMHAHFLTVAAHVAHIVHLLTDVPYSVTAHAKDIYRRGVNWEVGRRVAMSASTIVTVCDANLRHLEHQLPGAHVTRIYNGLAPQPAPEHSLDAREPFTVVGVGRLVEKKGYHVLLEAAARMRRTHPELRVVLLGDGEERASLEAQSIALGLGHTVEFTGAVLQDEVGAWLRRAHVLAAPCLVGDDGNQDALPTVLLEGLAAGIPAVSTSIAGIPEIIEDGVHGLIVAPGDATALADGLTQLMTDRASWQRMSLAGPAHLAARFDRQSTIRSLIDVFSSTPVRSR